MTAAIQGNLAVIEQALYGNLVVPSTSLIDAFYVPEIDDTNGILCPRREVYPE